MPYSPYPQPPTSTMLSLSSDAVLQLQIEQTKSLGRIEANQEMQGQRIDRLEVKFDKHVEDCRRPRRRLISTESLKENWTAFLLAFQLVVFIALQMLGQPDKAQQVWATSPAFQRGAKDAD